MQSNMSKRKALYIVLSLVVAMAIWVYVDISGDRNIKKTFTNCPWSFWTRTPSWRSGASCCWRMVPPLPST